MGLVKIDLLGNRSLAVIRDAIADLARQGIVIDENKWDPASDKATIEILATGRTMGVFYVESPAMRILQQKTGRGDFEHMVIHSSIIRPAANRFINEYVRRLKGGAWKHEHPCLDFLSDTYGIMVYQEDVTKTAMAAAGFSCEEADGLRKIISKKDRYGKLENYRCQFFSGAAKKRIALDSAERLWQMCMSFAGYSFCKPHSASYVQVSFQSAWLKAHYPAAFLAAVMSNYGGFYVTQAYVSEAQRFGIIIEGPDVNESLERYYSKVNRIKTPKENKIVKPGTIRVGLCQIKGLSKKCRESILAERKKNGRYSCLAAFLSRTEISETDAEKLTLAGALDSLAPDLSRAQIFWKMRCFYQGYKTDNQLPELRAWAPIKILREQYRMLGYLTSCHPMQCVKRTPVNGEIKIGQIESCIGKPVVFAGWCITSKTVATSEGEPMQFVTFEDETGTCECVLFPESYRNFVRILGWKEAFVVKGKVKKDYGAVTVIVDNLAPV
jgi:DNA polymerase-3 subunit alpha/error-prone DNA polymerase